MSQIRNFVFTCNNWTQDSIKLLEELPELFKCTYYIYGKEKGEKETPHLQGYAELENRIVFDKLQKHLRGFHIDSRRGSQLQAITYCKKEGDYHTYGTPKVQGTRSDLYNVKQFLDNDSSMVNLLNDESVNLNHQSFRTAERLLKYCDKPRVLSQKPYVVWIFGKPGAGKTLLATSKWPHAYFKSNATGKWWPGYDGQEAVIIDDARMQMYPFTFMLGLLDRFPFQVEDKGFIRQFKAKSICVTSPCHPETQYSQIHEDDPEDINQLLRRIDIIIEIKDRMLIYHKDFDVNLDTKEPLYETVATPEQDLDAAFQRALVLLTKPKKEEEE